MILRLVQLAVFVFVSGFTSQVALDNNTHASGMASAIVGVTAAVGVTLIWETFRVIGLAAQRSLSPRHTEDRVRVEPYLHQPEVQDGERLGFQGRLERDD